MSTFVPRLEYTGLVPYARRMVEGSARWLARMSVAARTVDSWIFECPDCGERGPGGHDG
ncbi:MAG: hypothetical protein JF621_12170 [Streptomyces turgidiscabies]|nr:hypothetical protein [Streptomyces turgidiscabies]